jgi:hypothetical protein
VRAGGLKNIVGTIVGMVALTIDARDMEMGAGGYNFDDVANWLFHQASAASAHRRIGAAAPTQGERTLSIRCSLLMYVLIA